MTKTNKIVKNTNTTLVKSTLYFSRNYIILTLLFFTALFATAAADNNDPIRTLLPFDAIPAIINPQFVPAEKAKINSYDPVIGVTLNDESHVYSIYLLNGHEIVNDIVGGEKIATTW